MAGQGVIATTLTSSGMTVNSVAVGVAATQITPENPDRQLLAVANNSPSVIYVGPDSTVTTATGFPHFAHTTIFLEGYTGEMWGIVASGSGTIHTMEF